MRSEWYLTQQFEKVQMVRVSTLCRRVISSSNVKSVNGKITPWFSKKGAVDVSVDVYKRLEGNDRVIKDKRGF